VEWRYIPTSFQVDTTRHSVVILTSRCPLSPKGSHMLFFEQEACSPRAGLRAVKEGKVHSSRQKSRPDFRHSRQGTSYYPKLYFDLLRHKPFNHINKVLRSSGMLGRVCSCLPVFRDSLSVPSSRVKQSKKNAGQQMDLPLLRRGWCGW
jgi:hypothetical protein